MAEQVVIEFAADTTKLQPAIDFLVKINQLSEKDAAAFKASFDQTSTAIKNSAAQSISQVQKLSQEFKNLKTNAAAGVMLDQSAGITKTITNIVSLREQIKQATALTAELSNKFGELDSRTIAAAKNAANLKERFSDAQKQIAALNPEAKFTAFSQLGGVLAGAFQAATGALQAFGVESETATKLAQQFQGAINIAAGLNQLTGLKDALTNVKAALGITTTATVAATAANEALAVSEGAAAVGAEGAAVATKSFTAALLTNPITLALVAIAALASAYVLLSDDADDAALSIDRLNDAIKLNTEQAEINRRIADDTATALEGQIEIMRVQGDSADEILKKEIELNGVRERNARRQAILNESEIQSLEDQASALAGNTSITEEEYKKQADVLFKRIDALKSSNKQLKAEADSYQSDTLVKTAQFGADQLEELKKQIEKEKQLNADRLKEKRDLELRIREIGISLIKDEFEQRRQQLILAFDKEIDTYAEKLEQKKITLEDFNEIFTRLNNKLTADSTEVTRQGLIRQFADEESLRKEQTDKIVGIIRDQNIILQTEDLQALNDRIDAKRSALLAQGLDEVEIAKQTAEFINSELRALNAKRLDDELKSLEHEKDVIVRSGGDIVAIESQIAQKRTEISRNTNQDIIDIEQEAANKREKIQEELFAGFTTGLEIFSGFADIRKEVADREIADIERVRDIQLSAYDDLLSKNKENLKNRIIDNRDFTENEKSLIAQREAAEKESQKRLNAEKRKQDAAEKLQKAFQIAIATARNIAEQPGPFGLFIPFWAALGIAQEALVLSKPAPRYFKGTPSLQDPSAPHGRDTIPVMANRGEAIIPTDTTEQYRQAINAIYYRKVPAEYMNRMAMGYGKQGSPTVNVSGMTIDYDKLGRSLAYHIKGTSDVRIRNIKEFASIFESTYDPRRQ